MDDGTTIDVTITDMTNPCVFFKAADFGLGLTELELSNPDGTLTGPPGVQDRLAGLRLRTMFLAYKSRRSMTGSSMAAITRCRSGASTLVAGTSAYIHAARTSANASEPCKVNTSSSRALGRRNHAKLMKAALAATVLRVA
jgi:2-methylaconitate cis-trans-isomerase PrpF